MSESVNHVEQIIINATNFVPEKNYRKRNDYLGALLRAVTSLSDPVYDKLVQEHPEVGDWADSAADIYRNNKDHGTNLPLPDFANGNGVIHAGDETGSNVVHEYQHDPEQGDNETNEEHEEQEGRAAIQGQVVETDQGKKEPKKRNQKVKTKVAKPKKEAKTKTPARDINRWGVAAPSKSDTVCRMLAQEGGTTQKDIKEATGQTHYNLCARLLRHGHQIIKNGTNLRLIHRDDA